MLHRIASSLSADWVGFGVNIWEEKMGRWGGLWIENTALSNWRWLKRTKMV
jgi:hypothetical protein